MNCSLMFSLMSLFVDVAFSFFFENTNQLENPLFSSFNVKQNSENIHLEMIDKPFYNNVLKTKTGKIAYGSSYIEIYDNLEKEEYLFSDLKDKKVILYSSQSEAVMMRRYTGFFEFQEFLIHKGDSIIMSFDTKKPIVVKYSRFKYAPQDFNVENILNDNCFNIHIYVGKATNLRMSSFKYFFDDPKESAAQLKRSGSDKVKAIEQLEVKVCKDLLPSTTSLQKKTQVILDSLLFSKQISQPVYDFYKNKYANILLKLEIMTESKDSIAMARQINNVFDDKAYVDEYFNQCLESFQKVNYQPKIIPYEQSNIRDHREGFILVKNSKLLNSKVKDRLLFLSLGQVDICFRDEVETYLKIFVENASDSFLVKKANLRYQKDVTPATTPSNLHLLALDQTQVTIEEFVAGKKGKILYIDFWASWCGPCIQEMKYSRSLIDQYADKGLEVVFLSMDDSFQKWEKAAIKQSINKGNCLKVLDSKGSSFIQEYKITTIPRYMIIDKDGKVVNANAPRPSDPKVKQVLDRLVEK